MKEENKRKQEDEANFWLGYAWWKKSISPFDNISVLSLIIVGNYHW